MNTYKFNIDITNENGTKLIANSFGQIQIEHLKNYFSEKTNERITKAIEFYELKKEKEGK